MFPKSWEMYRNSAQAFAIANEANLEPEELDDLERREIFIQDQRGAITKATRLGMEEGIRRGIRTRYRTRHRTRHRTRYRTRHRTRHQTRKL
jgi:hypothetical protein